MTIPTNPINPTYSNTPPPVPRAPSTSQPAPSRFSLAGITNTLAWATGACSGYFGLDYLLTHDYLNYREELLAKVPDENLQQTLSHLATALGKQLRQSTKSGFMQGLLDSNDARVTELMQTLLLHSLVTLKGTSSTPNIIQASAENFLKTVHEFSKKEHRTLRASCQAYKMDQAPDTKKAALEVLNQEFTPLVDELIKSMGLDEKSLSKIVHTKADALQAALRPWLTEQCVDWYLEFSKSEHFNEQESEKLNAMGGKEIVHLLSETLTEKSFFKINQACSESCDQIALRCSEKILPSSLSLEDQCTIAKNISGIFAKNSQTLHILSDLLHTPVTTILTNGLCRLALHSPDSSGNTLERLEGYIKNIIKDLKIDPELSKRIKLYRSKIQEIEVASDELEALKIDELNDAIDVTRTRKAKIKELETLIDQLTNSIDVTEKERLLQAFRPLVKKLISDMGYEKASDLPLPTLVQNAAYSHICDIALPELLIDYYNQLTDAIDSLTKESKNRSDHAENLRERFGNDKLINTARPFAKVLIQSIKSSLLVESKNLAAKGAKQAQKLAENQEKLETVLTKNRKKLVSWVANHGGAGVEHIDAKYGQIIEE